MPPATTAITHRTISLPRIVGLVVASFASAVPGSSVRQGVYPNATVLPATGDEWEAVRAAIEADGQCSILTYNILLLI